MPATDAQVRVPRVDTAQAVELVRAGGVIAYPTEAVYGLGCDPANQDAVQRILATKARPGDKGLILAASDITQLQAWITPLSKAERERLQATWPGHTTWIVQAHPDCPQVLTGGRDSLAVRVSAHPVVRALCDGLGHALVSTSANRSGAEAIRDPRELDSLVGVDAVVHGDLGGAAKPSAIFRLSDNAQLR